MIEHVEDDDDGGLLGHLIVCMAKKDRQDRSA